MLGMHNSRDSVVRTSIKKESHKIEAILKEVPRVSIPAKTINRLLKIFSKNKFLIKEKTSENTVLFF